VDFEVEWFLQYRPNVILLVVTDGADPTNHPERIFPKRIIEAGLHKDGWYDFRRCSIFSELATRHSSAQLRLKRGSALWRGFTIALPMNWSQRSIPKTSDSNESARRSSVLVGFALAMLAGVAIYFALARKERRGKRLKRV
jgi:hypothetical protein